MHTGDFKLDHTPIDGVRTDLARLAALGERGVALMLGDSTNAEDPGTTAVRAVVAEALRRIVREAPGRVIVTSFASHIHRLQEVIDAAAAGRPQGLRRRALDGQEPQHRAQPRATRTCRRGC